MNKNKLTHVHVYIIGGVLMLFVGVGLFFALLKPLDEKNKLLNADIEGKKTTPVSVDGKQYTIEGSGIPNAQKALAAAEVRRALHASQLAAMERKKQLPPQDQLIIPAGGPDLKTSLPRWFLIQPKMVVLMQKYAQASAKKHGVKVTTAFAAGAPSTDVKTIRTDIVPLGLGTITIQGPFPNVLAYVKDWNAAPLLAAVSGLKCTLADRKGVVDASASVIAYAFPVGPGVTAGAGGVAAGGGPAAGPGGAPGGAPGGPGGNMAGGGPPADVGAPGGGANRP